MMVNAKTRVAILTYCAHPVLAYGTLLVFKSLRTGFPTAEVEVYDNASHPEVRAQIELAARSVGASFHQMPSTHYADHLRWLLLERPCDDYPLVLVDPDVVFWRAIEDWSFGEALMAGRLIPQMHQGSGDLMAVPRLHPSLFWVPSILKLRAEVGQVEQRAFGWDGIAQRTAHVGGSGLFWDTLAGLYNAMPGLCQSFGEAQLNCYDHLFFGSHIVLGAGVNTPVLDTLKLGHELAAKDQWQKLKGIWRRQQAAFESLSTPERAEATANDDPTAGGRMAALASEVQAWQGMGYTGQDLQGVCATIAQRIHSGATGRLGAPIHDTADAQFWSVYTPRVAWREGKA